MEVVNPPQQQKVPLPNATTTLVLGILSIVIGCGSIGLILGIIGLVLSKEANKLYDQNPDGYTGYGSLNAGRILCIIGIVIGSLAFTVLLFWILGITALIGTAASFGL
jgi:hypothetical protein